MENDLKHPKDDTFRIALLYNLAEEYYGYDTSKGMRYLEEGFSWSKKINYYYDIADYYEVKAKLYLDMSRLDIMPLLDTAISYYEKYLQSKPYPQSEAQTKLSIATCKSEKALVFENLGKYKEAIEGYLMAVEAWKASDDRAKYQAIGNYYNNISTLYLNLKQYDKALEYDEAAIPYRLLDNNDEFKAKSYLYVGDDFLSLSKPDSALHYIQLAKPLVVTVNKHKLNYDLFTRFAKIYRAKKDYPMTVLYCTKTMKEADSTANPKSISFSRRLLSECYMDMKEFDAARKYLLVALPVCESSHNPKDKLEILKDLVTVEDKTNHPAQAYVYLKQVNIISDSLKQIESKTAVAEIENKYQATQKEKEIIQLQKDKQIQSLSIRQRSILNDILIGSLVVVLLLGLLLYRNYRQKQQLQQQQISELEKDRQLMAVDAMLKGQEEERSRLAKDLHDGLGGMLSGVKYSLNNMKDNLIVTPDNMTVFERSLDLIDTSIRELRRVAHNMMPEMLVKFGLDEALKEYCNAITATGLLKVKYQTFGLDSRLDTSVEIIIYRIVQELLNNTLKHAGAKDTLVQLVKDENRLNVLVEDNGRGFDTSLLETNKSAGWTNIRSRVDYLKGRLDIHSEIGMGTSVSVEFNV